MEPVDQRCPECGKKNLRYAEFCLDCGNRLGSSGDANGTQRKPMEIPWKIRNELHELLSAQKYIEAIRVYRENTSQPLKESKEAVDAYAREMGIETVTGRSSGWNCAGIVLGFLLWMGFIAVMPFVAQWLAPRVFGPDISRDSVETMMAILPMAMTFLSLAVFFLFMLRSARRRRDRKDLP